MENENARKIVIRSEDIESSAVSEIVSHLEQAKQVPLVREIGVEKKSYDSLISIVALVAAGLIGGFLTWIVFTVLPEQDDATAGNIQASIVMTLTISLVLVSADAALSRSVEKLLLALAWAVPSALAISLLTGFIASSVYTNLVEDTIQALSDLILNPDLFVEEFRNRNHLNRGLAWSFIGLAAGLAVGIPSKSVRRILINAIGGFIGGFLGGFQFDFFEGEDAAQIIGFSMTGAAIGLSVSLLEQATKSSWIEIVSGGMAGKQFILHQREVTIGSSPRADVTLIKDSAIPDIAAKITKFGAVAKIEAQSPIEVNGVSGFSHQLAEGSVFTLGSTVLRFRERAKDVKNSSILRG